MSVGVHARHDAIDLRRLAELGITALEWRNPPTAPMRVVVVESDDAANATLKDIVKGLAIIGIAVRLRGSSGADAGESDKIVIRFAAVADATSATGNGNMRVLPALANLRGNAVAKRQAWSQLRTLLRL